MKRPLLPLLCSLQLLLSAPAAEPPPVAFTVKLETVLKHDDGKFLWFHPRAAAIPARGQAGLSARGGHCGCGARAA